MPFTGSRQFDPLDAAQDDVRYDFWTYARQNEPVFHSEKYDVWFLTRYEDVDAAQKDHAHFSTESVFFPSQPWPASVRAILETGYSWKYLLSNNDPPEHTPLKRAVMRAFTRAQTARLETRIQQIADELIDGFAAEGSADVGARLAYSFPALVVMEILGFPREDMEQLKTWGDDWLTLFSDSAELATLEDAARGFVAFQNYMLGHFRDREQNPRDDLMTALVQELDGRFTVEDIVNVPINIMTAGHETGTLLMLGALSQLLSRPALLARVQADPELVPRVVEEALRLEPPVHGIFRTTKAPVTVGAETIPADARVLLVYGSANHDPSRFTDPDTFDIDRTDVHQHLGFGKGTHFCPGAVIARLEQKVAIETLLRRCPNLRLNAGREPQRLHHFWLRGFTELWVEWDVPS